MHVIRPAVPTDAAAIAAIHTASWRDAYAPLLPDGALGPDLAAEHRGLWERVLAPSASMRAVLVAVEGARVLGFAATHPDRDDPGADHLAALHTDPRARGKGVGAALMREIADRLGALGRQRLWCWVLSANAGARRFYARLGAVEGAAALAEIVPGIAAEEVRVEFASLRALGAAARASLVARLGPPLVLASADVAGEQGAPHPVASAERARRRVKRRLGDPFGLSQFGVNRLELEPGASSSIPHAHSHEDEFVMVIEGEAWLVSGKAETRLGPGDCAGFAGGGGRAHHLENRSSAPAVVLEIGSRLPDLDEIDYPRDGLRIVHRPDGLRVYRRRDGSEIGPSD